MARALYHQQKDEEYTKILMRIRPEMDRSTAEVLTRLRWISRVAGAHYDRNHITLGHGHTQDDDDWYDAIVIAHQKKKWTRPTHKDSETERFLKIIGF